MSAVRWTRGGEAQPLSIDGDRARFSSTASAAPGTPLEGALDDGAKIMLKVQRCRREGEVFLIEGRLIDASRALRTRLQALVTGV